MPDELARWLKGLGLGDYAPAFADNAVELAHLPYLTDGDLVALGLPLGPRRRLQAAIKALAETGVSSEREGAAVADSAPEAAKEATYAERRQLTVLFCDLVGSTELAGRLDPEDMARVIGSYQDEVARQVANFDGHPAKFLGDGVLAYFGWPRAHEDDPERAVRAGLAMTEAIGHLQTAADRPLETRVGIATGLVVVGDMIGESGTDKGAVVGETPNLAARLQSVARPGTVVVSRETRHLLGELFELGDLGSHELKGFDEPVSVWQVLGESRAESRFDALHGAGLTPLVGREHEVALLLDRWQVAKGGEGQVALISSEAGVGKSRMVRTLRERLGDRFLPVSHYGSPYQRAQALPVLVMVSARPEFVPPWTGLPHVVALSLSRLGRRHVAAIVHSVTGGKSLPPEVLDQILAKTDGIPLFVEELTKTVLESGMLTEAGDHFELSGPLPALAIPATLHDSLLARLDRLAHVKEVAQVGAVIGRAFSYDLLASIVPGRPASELRASLDELVRSGLVLCRGTPPEAVYTFKNALVHDAAYASLLKSRRNQLHARIAAVLEERFPETVATEPETLAHHLSQAGMQAKAVDYWRKAGEIAVRRSANVEAVAHFSKALEGLKSQPEDRARSERELALQMALAVPLVAAKGWSAIEVKRAYSRAQDLCESLGKQAELFPVLRGLWNHYLGCGALQQAHDLAVRVSAQAQEHGGPLQRALAHRALGTTLFFLGRFAESLDETSRAIAVDDALEGQDGERGHLFLYGERPGIISRLYAGWASWFVGFPDRAVAHFEQALTLAERLGHAYSLAFAHAFAAGMRNDRRDFAAALECAKAASRIAAKHDLPSWLGESAVAKGYAEASLGNHAEGIEELRNGISRLERIGDGHHRTHWLGFLASAHLEAGAYGDARAALDAALETVAATQERYYAPELERLRGMLWMLQGRSEDAVASFQAALDAAVTMGAKSLELRAATSLARLWSKEGRGAAARDLLAPVYGWFTEGFETADLKDARALLDELR